MTTEKEVDPLMAALISHAGERRVADIEGVGIPSFSLQYVAGINVIPFGRIISIAGPYQSCKSALAFEIGRWFIESGGYCIIADTEMKISPSLVEGIHRTTDRTVIAQFELLEEWQEYITSTIKEIKNVNSKGEARKGGNIYKDTPILIIIDSMVGAPPKKLFDTIMTDGVAPGAGYPINAMMMSQYINSIKAMIANTKISVLFTNHVRQKMDPMSAMHGANSAFAGKKKLGGDMPSYIASLDIWTNKLGRKETASFEFMELELRNMKNSIGAWGRRSRTNFCWKFQDTVEHEEAMQQIHWFDWDKADATFLCGDAIAKLVKEIVPGFKKEAAGRISTDVEGLSGVGSVVAAAIRDSELVNSLYSRLGIMKYKTFRSTIIEESNGADKKGTVAEGADA